MKKSLIVSVFAFIVFAISASSAHAATVYFWSNGSNAAWTTTGNWYTDAGTTTPKGSVPTGSDTVVTVGTVGPQVNLNTWTHPASINANATGITFNGSINNYMGINVTGSTTFNGGSFNYGAITGSTTFNGSSFNNGTIIGPTTFNSSNGNNGTITGSTTFNGSSYNQGTITGTAIFTNATGGIMTVPDGEAWGSGTATSIVGADLSPITQWIFNGSSNNSGIITGSTTFNGSSYNQGTITGTTTFNGSSYNQGTITGTAIFTNATGGIMTVPDGGAWGSGTATSIVGADLSPITQWIFNGSSNNSGTITGSTTFNGSSYNYGTITGSTTFNGSSYNYGTITGTAIFTNATGGIMTVPDGGQWGSGIATSIVGVDLAPITQWIFNGSSYNTGTITGSTTFNGTSYNDGSITGTTTFNDGSGNLSSDGATITGNAIFNATSTNDYVSLFSIDSIKSKNLHSTTTSSNSIHTNDIHTADFFNITGNATFNGDLSENLSGTISGIKTRHYTSDVSPTRNFVLDGPWTVLADGAIVNLTGATYDTNTDASTTVFEINNCNGSFLPTSITATVIGTPCAPATPPTPPAPPRSSGGGGSVSPSALAALLAPSAYTTQFLADYAVPGCPSGYTCTPTTNTSPSSPTASSTFTRNLTLGSTGLDVQALQIYLNTHGFTISSTGAGSSGHESTYFGLKTQSALAKFQKAHGITPAVGYFGPITRAYVNAHQ